MPPGSHRRTWSPHVKAAIILEGLRGRPVSELCREHGICHSLFYKWKDMFLANAFRAFERDGRPERLNILEAENERLKRKVGELLLALNGFGSADK